jgi:hypothetical protein
MLESPEFCEQIISYTVYSIENNILVLVSRLICINLKLTYAVAVVKYLIRGMILSVFTRVTLPIHSYICRSSKIKMHSSNNSESYFKWLMSRR